MEGAYKVTDLQISLGYTAIKPLGSTLKKP